MKEDWVSTVGIYLLLALIIYAVITTVGAFFGYEWDFIGFYDRSQHEREIYAP